MCVGVGFERGYGWMRSIPQVLIVAAALEASTSDVDWLRSRSMFLEPSIMGQAGNVNSKIGA